MVRSDEYFWRNQPARCPQAPCSRVDRRKCYEWFPRTLALCQHMHNMPSLECMVRWVPWDWASLVVGMDGERCTHVQRA